MESKIKRVKINFGGIRFSGIVKSKNNVTVPINVLKKLFASGKIKTKCHYHVYNSTINNEQQIWLTDNVLPSTLIESLKMGKPWMASYNPYTGKIKFCPNSNIMYTISEKKC